MALSQVTLDILVSHLTPLHCIVHNQSTLV